MFKPSSKTERMVVAFLKVQVKAGHEYFKARQVGKEIGLSPREVGTTISLLRSKPECKLNIEAWSGSRSFTWKVTMI